MSIIAIVTLIASVAPKLISAGSAVYDLWKDAGDIIRDAEADGGKVDEAAYAALINKCDQLVTQISQRAEEAQKFLDENDPA